MTNKTIFLPKNWTPQHRDDLVRLGRDNDGGYVISQRIVKHTDAVVGLGVCDDWSFEADFFKRKKVRVHCYDYSVNFVFFMKLSIKEMFKIVFKPKFDRLRRIFLPISYKCFFNNQDRVHFTERIGYEEFGDTSAKKIFSRIPPKEKVFMKIDIEGAEYRVVEDFESYFDRITGFVIEFHSMDLFKEKLDLVFQKFGKAFDLIHIHASNMAGFGLDGIPTAIEFTFENKNLFVEGERKLSQKAYPLPELDQPQDKTKADFVLKFQP